MFVEGVEKTVCEALVMLSIYLDEISYERSLPKGRTDMSRGRQAVGLLAWTAQKLW
jgi:hypothetical protein